MDDATPLRFYINYSSRLLSFVQTSNVVVLLYLVHRVKKKSLKVIILEEWWIWVE